MTLKAKIEAFKEHIKAEQKQEAEFKETKAGKQLAYNEFINITILMIIGIFLLGFLTMVLIIPQNSIKVLFSNSLISLRFLFVLSILAVCTYVYFVFWISSFIKFQRGLTKWTKQKD
jgi:uncharacterized membrane protein YraQ (UPF0718 family)